MATCGYICPQCEGKQFMDDGSVCSWCQPENKSVVSEIITTDEWIQSVHFGYCCSDSDNTHNRE